ncbi:hypothetical protein K0504_10535 [Neiella marina]|uniref:DUF3108 domain-containing protein n=1 Tax=Neiella holothuriorum TaxID=2870530 RepID=A0ABS7EGN4_9GAMM|nr:hypothetical protein [Neiella holothuriorum]MBW8191473.1 hypothetical protein [Neiella holothuriorum]
MNTRKIPTTLIPIATVISTLVVGTTALSLSFNAHAGIATEAANCVLDKQHLSANYTLTRTFDIGRSQTKSLTLWRNANEVALQYPQEKITEVWTRGHDGRSRPVRYFDQYQRGIEYFPDEVKNSRSEQVWQTKYQLIDDEFRSSMALVASTGSGCQRTETYELKKQGKIYRLVWQPQSQLVVEYREKAMSQDFVIKLQEVSQEDDKIEQFFVSRQAYQTTDYADVGDNESDPFLRKMMNLGFVSHGASGFYSADGKPLGGSGHAH